MGGYEAELREAHKARRQRLYPEPSPKVVIPRDSPSREEFEQEIAGLHEEISRLRQMFQAEVSSRPQTASGIIREVAAETGWTPIDIISHRTQKDLVFVRHYAMWRCKRETIHSYPEIGSLFGGRDHTTIRHGVKAHEKRIAAREPNGLPRERSG